MSKFPDFRIDSQWITSQRTGKNPIDPGKPYHFFVEKENITGISIDDVSTILLTNNECPIRCIMCDLWKNTTDEPLKPGDIPAQINYALSRLPSTKHLKLYNSGSFFDPRAIPIDD